MRARLGFATADAGRPERSSCSTKSTRRWTTGPRALVQERAREILAAGGIVVAAGHDHPLLEQLSKRALWLDRGRIVSDGPFAAVRDAYLAAPAEHE